MADQAVLNGRSDSDQGFKVGPYGVACGAVVLALAVGFILESVTHGHVRDRWPWLLATMGVAGVTVCIVAFGYLYDWLRIKRRRRYIANLDKAAAEREHLGHPEYR